MKLDCILFSYAKYQDLPQWVKDMDNNPEDFCRLVIIYKGQIPHFVKYLDPEFLKSAGYNYVVFGMDDVQLYGPEATYEFESFFRFVQKYKLAVASPAIVGTPYSDLRPNHGEPNHAGRRVDTIEIQSTTFSIDAWKCFWKVSDTEFPSGWYENFLVSYCQIKDFGIMNNQTIVHLQPNGTTNKPSKGPHRLYDMQVISWKEHRNITLSGSPHKITGYLD